MENILQIKKINNEISDLDIPKNGNAGIDLKSSGNYIIDLDEDKKEIFTKELILKPNERVLVKTGLQVKIPPYFWGNIRDRSGLALKNAIHTLGGVIDENYRGEIGVILINLGLKDYTIKKNDRIAQMIITPYIPMKFEYVNELDITSRNEGGFGSTGR